MNLSISFDYQFPDQIEKQTWFQFSSSEIPPNVDYLTNSLETIMNRTERILTMFRVKAKLDSDFRIQADAKGNYYQWVSDLSNRVKDLMEHMNLSYEKALSDTVDPLGMDLMDFETASWVLSSSMNRDSYLNLGNFRQKGLNFYSSAAETMATMAMYAIEKDIEDLITKEYDITQMGGKSRTMPLQELVDTYRIPQSYDNLETDPSESETVEIQQPEQSNPQSPVSGPKTQNLRVPR